MQRNWIVRLIPLFCGALLCGACSTLSKRSSVTAPDATKIAKDIREMYAAAGVPVPTTATQPTVISPPEFATSGYRIVDINCNAYFDALVRASNRVKMTKADITAVGTAAGVIATLAKSAPKEIGIFVAGFGLAETIVDNVEQYAFVTPYPVQTRGLVLKAMNEYRASSSPASVTSLSEAADQIAGYASLCSYSGIAVLSAEAIAKAEPEDVSRKRQLLGAQDRLQLELPIVGALGLPPNTLLSDSDLATLAAISDPSTPDASLAPLTMMLSPSFTTSLIAGKLVDVTQTPPARVSSSLNAIWGLMSPVLGSNPEFKKFVDDRKKAVAGGAVAPTPPPSKRPMIAVK